jgi:hypothetical protein
MSIDNCPPMSWGEFLSIPDGTEVFNHGASECVALANQYNEGVLGGGFVMVGAAKDWWFNQNVSNVHGFTRIDSNPQVGDIFIASGDIYDNRFGHIGVVVRAWDGSTFGTMEQNAGIPNAVSRHNRTMANVDGFLRPINQAVPAPAPAPEPIPTPTVEEVKEIVQPAPKPTPVPVVTRTRKKRIMSKKEEQAAIAALPQVDLGVIIPTVKARKIAYIVYACAALLLGNVGVGFAAAGEGWPTWLVVAVAVTNNLAVPFATIAVANASNKK